MLLEAAAPWPSSKYLMFLRLPETGMNPSKKGLSSAGKTGVVVVLIIIVLAAAYLAPSLTKGGGSPSRSSNSSAVQINGMVALFQDFPRMQVAVGSYNSADGSTTNQSLAYTVLGTGTLTTTATTTLANGSKITSSASADYTKVEFTTIGIGHNIVAWYNSTGAIIEEDIIGERNYTGNGVPNLPFMIPYTSAFGELVSVTDNATLLSHLSKTSESTMSIGPTQMDVTTYVLAVRSPPYSSMTVRIATIPGTNVTLAVYVNAKLTDGSTSLIQVTSLTR
jgi:hypothetical protein